MAGGRGERFWPAGRLATPKQLLSFGGNGKRTMIEETVQRLFPLFTPENILVITGKDYADEVRKLLPIPAENIISEPVRRNTSGCIALAAAVIKHREKGSNAVMTILPADHVITPVTVFHDTLKKAAVQAQEGALVTIGIIPNRPDTGYGYINIGESACDGVFKVSGFREKPDAETAREYFLSGQYRWNSGIFVWKLDVITEKFRRYLPAWGRFIDNLSAEDDIENYVAAKFADNPSISIDYSILEKSSNIRCVDGNFYWNDLGSWSSLFELEIPDADGNVTRGKNILIDSRHCVVCGDSSTLIGVIGMRDVAVIKSGNGILVCPLSEEQRVREIIRAASGNPDYEGFI